VRHAEALSGLNAVGLIDTLHASVQVRELEV
jgi:hypothetical protein